MVQLLRRADGEYCQYPYHPQTGVLLYNPPLYTGGPGKIRISFDCMVIEHW